MDIILSFQFRSISLLNVMQFGKPWLRVKLFIFHLNAKSSSTDNNELNKPNLKSLVHVGSEKSLVELGIRKNELLRKAKSKI